MSAGGVRDERAVAATVTASTQISLARRAFLPSPLEEIPGQGRIDAFARLRGLFTLSAIFVDLGIYFGFRGSSHFNAACAGTLDDATRARASNLDRKRDSSPAHAATLAVGGTAADSLPS